jgi:hypothetical protein
MDVEHYPNRPLVPLAARLGGLERPLAAGPAAERPIRQAGTSSWVRGSVSGFGRDDPREMPVHFFYGSIRIDYESAVRADTARQNCSICPRYWYIDASFRCVRCDREFAFTAGEQRTWYEEYGFWVDSLPKHCLPCREGLRNLKELRREYDREVAHAMESDGLERKKHLADVIDQLYEIGGELPTKIHENRRRLGRQIARLEEGAD